MDEIHELLESDELKTAVAAIEALHRKRYGEIVPHQQSIRELAFGRTFRAREVLQVLIGEDAGSRGQKAVLAAGFSAWVLFPKSQEMRLAWMTHAMLYHMDEAELKVGFAEQSWSLARDIVARYILTGSPFLNDVYNEFGGYQAFARSTSLEILEVNIENDVKVIRTIVRAMSYLHHGADMYRSNTSFYHKPSLNRAVKILNSVRESEKSRGNRPTLSSRSLMLDRWGNMRNTIALIYAASCLNHKRKPLLDIMVSGIFSYSHHGYLIKKWIQMGQYVSRHIFALMDDSAVKGRQRLTTFTEKLTGGGAMQKFSPQNLSRQERDLFRLNFSK